MKKYSKILALLTAMVFVLSIALTGCGGGSKTSESQSSQTQTAEQKKEPVELIVWSHLTDPEIAKVQEIANKWAEQTGNKVKVLADQSDFQAFATAAQSGKGPDIMFGLPHDNLGTFQKAGLLAEVPEGVINKDDYVPMSISAVSYDGKMYAVPIAMETYALFYNTDKVKTPPATLDDLIKLGKEVGFQYDVNNFYFSFAFIAAYGGYVFKDTGGGLDPNDIGLNNEGAKKGLELIKDFVQKYKFMPPDINYDMAKGNFQSGKIGLYISGPWDVDGFKKANVPFKVAPLPKIDGKPTPSFAGVQAAFVSANSKHQKEAWDLMKYLVENTGLPLFETGNRIPVIKSLLDNPEVKGNEILSAFAEQAQHAIPMPNIPQMSQVWTPAGNALQLITSGKVPVDKAADDMVKQIKQGIATMQ
ncbi:MAG: Maltose-binding periplasmic protein [Caldanaerobacter subterraneus]|uniref:Maltodextrin-binding protein n=3 Tax=Caldanaerobacter subterraneus TaxID=911092 RepID=Q8R901_CALS4|nr:maltose ABC transporter substrate-binding protein [Caldanaerobacter subterraneus]AAM25022.1 Maltose-binding periplasmic proteins/domains [Caldanaerobacter subterraneus subsp. tengcongensis MB4]KKC29284.1 maltose-binding periplasmic protein [Caldanaerobacter subterraneus subsp. pacificus DSM 12653]KUK09790.1 MAG: Maltose-binding periplasmic protein [Caldanaerobacter subterraneus]MCS3915394.1 arabinogalactan oligomer/maltooligosaccharide transport system substrate-binding protein [Caldanaeroba